MNKGKGTRHGRPYRPPIRPRALIAQIQELTETGIGSRGGQDFRPKAEPVTTARTLLSPEPDQDRGIAGAEPRAILFADRGSTH